VKTCAQCQIKYPDALEFCPQDGNPLPPTQAQTAALYDPYIGTTIDGRYQIEAKLGEGGMGVVYAARHVIIDKRVAIKILKKEAQEEETSAQRFIQEAKSASKIGHANIVDITDFGVLTDGSAYFVMEFLEGQTLGQAIARGPLDSRRVVSIAAQIARGLNAAHGKGIIHRDLKPENIFLLERDGHSDVVKIVDFGIAKVQSGGAFGKAGQRLTQVGMVLGTPEYMSPEQATGKETDHRVDEYALGCMMYEMITGEVPFRGENSASTLSKHVFDHAKPPSHLRPDLAISPALEALVLKTMAKKPEERFPGMRELLDALDQAGQEIDSGRDAKRAARAMVERSRPTVTSGMVPDADELPRRSRGGAIFAAVGAVVVVAGVGGWVAFGRNRTPEQPLVVAKPATLIPTAPVEPPPKKDPPPAAKPATVKLTMRTDPEGAEVFVGPELIGVAPVNYSHEIGEAPVGFTFRLAGYRDATRDVIPDGNKDVEVMLKKEPHASHHSSKSSPAPRETVSSPGPQGAQKPKVNGELRDPF
jgi:serine/threonine-protein kinase